MGSDMDDSDELEDGSEDEEEDTDMSEVDSEDEDDDDEPDQSKIDALHNIIADLSSQKEVAPRTKRARLEDPNELKAPSEYNISLGSASNKLTLNDLIPSINDPKIKKSIKLLNSETPEGTKAGVLGKLSAPLPKRQQDRIDRAAAYDKAKEQLGRWTETVKQNREADHLQFPLPDPEAQASGSISRLPPTAAFAPLTSLEADIASILKKSNMESEKKIAEFEELKTNKLSVEEVQKRTVQLRLARELLYREEIKAKRLKKIKSKSFRRVHKKEREKQQKLVSEAILAEGGEAAQDEDDDARERRRAEERMSLRHKQSRFAKGLRESGKGLWDEDARDAATEVFRRGEELTRRIMGKTIHGEDSDVQSSSEEESEEEDDQFDEVKQSQKLLGKLQDLENNFPEADDKSSMGRLMQMKFMKNAEKSKAKENRETLARLREDLEFEEHGSDWEPEEEEVEITGRRSFKPGQQAKEEVVKPKKKRVTEDGYAVASDEEEEEKDEERVVKTPFPITHNPPQNPFSRPGAAPITLPTVDKSRPFGGRKRPAHGEEEVAPAEPVNPWLIPADQSAARIRNSDPTSAFSLSSGKIDAKTAKANAKLSKSRMALLRKEQDAADGGGDEDITIDVSASSILTPQQTKPAPAPSKQQQKQLKKPAAAVAAPASKNPESADDDDNDGSDDGSDDDDDSDAEPNPAETTLIPVSTGTKTRRLPNTFDATQRTLVARAFAGDNVVSDFSAEKSLLAAAEDDVAIAAEKAHKASQNMPGWGTWAGDGVSKSTRARKRNASTLALASTTNKPFKKRRDERLPNVIISEKRVKRNAKYQATSIPFPFETREQYERSLRLPLGKEWLTKKTVQEVTMPRVLVKKGTVVEPMLRVAK
ncbi:small-subunit processome [Peziza echinospora]|nr:small-subunit processome [Peziza echinospora]